MMIKVANGVRQLKKAATLYEAYDDKGGVRFEVNGGNYGGKTT